jgi:hypothetical protein
MKNFKLILLPLLVLGMYLLYFFPEDYLGLSGMLTRILAVYIFCRTIYLYVNFSTTRTKQIVMMLTVGIIWLLASYQYLRAGHYQIKYSWIIGTIIAIIVLGIWYALAHLFRRLMIVKKA